MRTTRLAATLLALAGAPAAQDACLSFPGASSEVTFLLNGATTADLDGDGLLDLAATDGFLDTMSALLGEGDGTFTFADEQVFSEQPRLVIAVDANDDGLPDLCVTRQTGVSILLNAGGGQFGPPDDLALPAQIVGVPVSGDVDDDGFADLVVSSSLPAAVLVLLGQGDGTFAPPASYPAPGFEDIELADVDADGALDIVGVDPNAGQLLVSLGAGDGSFEPFSATTTGFLPYDVVAAHLDADGDLDVAVGTFTGGPTLPGLFVHHGGGDGSFSAGDPVLAGLQPWIVTAGDAQGDGLTDLLVGHNNTGSTSVLAGLPGGGLAPPLSVPVPYRPRLVALADCTEDGLADILSVDESQSTVRAGLGDGTFVAPASSSFPPLSKVEQVAAHDMDGDGDLDVAAADFDGFLWVAAGDGRGGLAPALASTTGDEATGVALGDVDLDGHADAVTCHRSLNQVWVLLGQPGGALAAGDAYPSHAGPEDVEIVDLFGDDLPELLVANRFADDLTVLRQGPTGFTLFATLPAGSSPVDVDVADLNLDGLLDIATLNNGDNVTLLLGDPDGTVHGAPAVHALNAPDDLVIADLDADGIPDLGVVGLGDLVMLPGLGNGTFGPPIDIPFGLELSSDGPMALDAADVDADGYTDIVTANGDGTCTLLLGQGPEAPSPGVLLAHDFGMQGMGRDLALVHMDDDGMADIVFGAHFPAAVLAVLGQCPPTWDNLGFGLPGAQGEPTLSAKGTLQPLSIAHIEVAGAAPASLSAMFVGLQLLALPFKGGTLVPKPDIVVPFVTGSAGGLVATDTVPPGVPPGTVLWIQCWISDAGAVKGFAASNALAGTTK